MEVRFARTLSIRARLRHLPYLYDSQPLPQSHAQPQWRPQGASFHSTSRNRDQKEEWKQTHPLGGYYEAILSSPTPSTSSRSAASAITHQPVPNPPSLTEEPSTSPSAPIKFTGARKLTAAEKEALEKQRAETAAKAATFFSPLTGPQKQEMRQKEIEKQSRMVAGVLVPPKPEEPDNCCMSGCVNCVWDTYGEEVEVWAARKKEAAEALAKMEGEKEGERLEEAPARQGQSVMGAVGQVAEDMATSIDDDGGGSQIDLPDDPLKDVPVGIREFMRQEKKLKERKMKGGVKNTEWPN